MQLRFSGNIIISYGAITLKQNYLIICFTRIEVRRSSQWPEEQGEGMKDCAIIASAETLVNKMR